MGLTKAAIHMAVKMPKIESCERFLFIGPHPDDIEIGCGATVSRLVSLGKKITYLICLDGRYGKEFLQEEITDGELAQRRRQESLTAAAYLGVSDVRFLNLCDAGQYSCESLRQGIASVINDVQPDILFAPDPDTGSECHIDHLNVGRAVKELAVLSGLPEVLQNWLPQGETANPLQVKAVALYMTAHPNRFVRTSGHLNRQLEAIWCHASQYARGSDVSRSLQLYLKLRSFEYGFRHFHRACEGFRVLDKTRMHCLPEAGL